MSQCSSALGSDPMEIFGAVPPPVTRFAQALVEDRRLATTFEAAEIVPGQSVCDLKANPDLARMSDVPGYEAWLSWVAHWVSYFADIGAVDAVNLRMSHSRSATCPRFHMDAVPLRLIATLLGPGTHWLRSCDVKFAPDGRIGQNAEPGSVQQLAPGSVGIFKGAGYGSAQERGVVHRSPLEPVDRVVFVLDIAA